MKVVYYLGHHDVLEKTLTIGKIYDTIPRILAGKINPNDSFYLIENDKGETIFYRKSFFITLEEYRNLKIDDILK